MTPDEPPQVKELLRFHHRANLVEPFAKRVQPIGCQVEFFPQDAQRFFDYRLSNGDFNVTGYAS
jgi:hypothetical protein